ncbi:hypothetical protein ACFQXB_06525 [Plastorhodobacter daqingensis]|uniref:Uncharacterized protein n=1 Tax=Plastorhodobacter daqingensis TaxID=1387281 RepID=A0ABW2UK81_9RHOB
MRRLARAVLLLAMAASLVLSGLNLTRLADTGLGRGMIARSGDEIAAALDRAMALSATPEAIAARLQVLLQDDPRNWVAIGALLALAEDRSLTLPPEVTAAVSVADAEDNGLATKAATCAACALDARHCPLSPVLACHAPSILTPLGDVFVVVREGGNYLGGSEVDELDLGLSVIGLGAVALVPLSGGTSYTIAMGARAGKLAKRIGLLSQPLQALLRDSIRRGVDWGAVARSRNRDDIARALRPEILRPVGALLTDAQRLRRSLGAREALSVLRHADSPQEARLLANAAEATGGRMLGPLELVGKSRFLRVTMRLADEVWYAMAGFVAFIAGLANLIASGIGGALMRRARKGLARPVVPMPPHRMMQRHGLRSS